MKPQSLHAELRGGTEAALQGLSTAIGPVLMFLALFGSASLGLGFWAAVVSAAMVPLVSLVLRGESAIIPSPRVASLTAYCALVLQLALASGPLQAGDVFPSAAQLRMGWVAGSVLLLAASVLVLVAGWLKLGHIFKMIPTPVIAGISNGTALLLVWYAFQQVHGGAWLGYGVAATMLALYQLVPALQTKFSALRYAPAVLIAPLVGWGIFTTFSPAAVLAVPGLPWGDGWLSAWSPLAGWVDLRHADWGRLLSIGVPGATTLALVMILETFTATSLMQSRFGVRTDGNRELLVLGGSNLIGALLGGVPSTGSTTRSLFSWLHGGRGLVASLTCLVLTTAMLLALGNWLLAIPACIFAGLFLMQVPQTVDRAFVHSLRTRPSASDLGFWITVAITLVAAFGNLIWACFMGVVLSCLVVLRHVSASLTGQWAYLDVHTSRRVRTAQDAAHLTAHQFQVGVLRLTGNLFFGNSPRLAQLSDEVHADAQITVVDIGQVTHADPSGIDAMVWLVHALVERKIQVILTGAQQCPATVLASTLQAIAGVTSCIDLDRGLECCENQVLAQRSTQHTQHLLVPPQANALLAGLDPGEIASVLALGQARSVAPGAALFCKGAPADGVWLLQVGSVSILAHGGQDSPRLATFGPGQFVGEMGLIDGRPRSATAQADTDVQALLIDNAAIATLVREYPVAALHLTRNIARELSLRLRTLPPH